MKLKTKLIGTDRNGSVTLTVESKSNVSVLTKGEQTYEHDRAVNNAHSALRARFDVLEIDVKRGG